MSLNLDKAGWKRVAFGDVVRNVNNTVKYPASAGLDRVIAMEHLDPGELKVTRWGDIADGTTFTRRVTPGQTLFGKRRAYQRKAAYAEFDAICSGDILTFEADPAHLLSEFLPFIVQSDGFYDHALGTSAGSLSPRTNWRDLSNYEFDLPPLDEQKRIADLMWALEARRRSLGEVRALAVQLRSSWLHQQFENAGASGELVELDELVDPSRPICYGVLMPGSEFAGGRLIVDVKDYPSGEILLDQVRRCDPEIERGFVRSRLEAGDVLLSIRGTIGRVALVPEELAGHNISRDSARIACDRGKVLPAFLKLLLEAPDVQAEIRRTTTGLAVKGINVAKIRSLRVPNWDLTRQSETVVEANRIDVAAKFAGEEAESLDTLRASLLADIFGGTG